MDNVFTGVLKQGQGRGRRFSFPSRGMSLSFCDLMLAIPASKDRHLTAKGAVCPSRLELAGRGL
jgi:hypothetical protein